MAHIKVLAIVLCSCFIQDALSEPSTSKRLRPTGGTQGVPTGEQPWDPTQQAGGDPRLLGVNRRQTGVNPAQTRVNPKLAGANQIAPGINKPEKGRPRRVQREAAVATARRPVYPYLERVQKMFWDMTEEINTDKVNGNKIMRAVRNSMGSKTDPAYWNALHTALRWYGKPTQDPIKAETRMRMCNAVADALTRPDASDQFLAMISVVINAMEQVDATPYAEALQKAGAAVNDGTVAKALDAARAQVASAVLDPAAVTKTFNKIKTVMDTSNAVNVTDSLANRLNKIGSKLNNKKT